MWSKPVYTNRKSASAERCLRALGATLAMGIPVMRRSKHSRQGVFSHQGLRKASAADPVNTGLAGSAGMAGKLLRSVVMAQKTPGYCWRTLVLVLNSLKEGSKR